MGCGVPPPPRPALAPLRSRWSLGAASPPARHRLAWGLARPVPSLVRLRRPCLRLSRSAATAAAPQGLAGCARLSYWVATPPRPPGLRSGAIWGGAGRGRESLLSRRWRGAGASSRLRFLHLWHFSNRSIKIDPSRWCLRRLSVAKICSSAKSSKFTSVDSNATSSPGSPGFGVLNAGFTRLDVA